MFPESWYKLYQKSVFVAYSPISSTCKNRYRSTHYDSAVMNPTSIHEDEGSILGLTQWVKDLVLP